MTCIVALAHEGKVYMGCDSAGVCGYSLQVRADPKIYRVGEFLFGFTSSFRMGQLLGYKFTPPDHDPRLPVEKYMVTEFIDKLRECLKAGGFAKKDSEVESAGTFLVAYKQRIFYVGNDYQVGENTDPYNACGCGEDLALGSLFSTQQHAQFELTPSERVKLALQAAERFSAGVRAPFRIETL